VRVRAGYTPGGKGDTDAPLPANVAAEMAILGAILLNNGHYQEAAGRIEAADFMLDAHRRVFQRMGELITEGRRVDIVTLAEQLQRNKELSVIGGVAWLAALTEGLPRRLSIEDYVRIVKDKSLLRQTLGGKRPGRSIGRRPVRLGGGGAGRGRIGLPQDCRQGDHFRTYFGGRVCPGKLSLH
jgi:hypothetical protein